MRVLGLREHGKIWSEVAARVGSQTAAQCKHFYRSQRQKLELDNIIAEYQASKVCVVFTLIFCVCINNYHCLSRNLDSTGQGEHYLIRGINLLF